ncbi:unnamed protein product [Darwinula stevensoni]|uniref:P/Homo B domain-containing protein n=1 Tax=Darwinula stevensoni TaxID=69355 RepID=A0A7R9FQQ1_9CRUS|nr:unnamed protein product [Darwinula stevensoni]CAG0899857.1 unnamed protein product [Darwinula stevensoni]
MDGMRPLLSGRGGRGSIYVWASGNGGTNGDNCNCDGYASSIYTLSVGSASENGSFPFYGEKCASTVAVTYSAGAYTDQTVATTDVGNACTLKHTGTSAAAPLAAGLVALTLQAKFRRILVAFFGASVPELTWRDMQHVVVWTADPLALERNAGWSVNAAGFPYSSRFGFGLLGAHRMVQAARRWAPVPPKSTCERAWSGGPFATNGSRGANASLETDGCHGTDREIRFLEHVELRLTVRYPRRGALRLGLTSPRGSESEVLSPRPKDKSKAGFRDWKFMSVHFWGEDPAGTWRFFLDDTERESMDPGEWRDVSLILHGTKDPPPYRAAGQSKLSALASTSHL